MKAHEWLSLCYYPCTCGQLILSASLKPCHSHSRAEQVPGLTSILRITGFIKYNLSALAPKRTVERLERLACRRVRRQLRRIITARHAGPPVMGHYEVVATSPPQVKQKEDQPEQKQQDAQDEDAPSTSTPANGSANNTPSSSQKREASGSTSG